MLDGREAHAKLDEAVALANRFIEAEAERLKSVGGNPEQFSHALTAEVPKTTEAFKQLVEDLASLGLKPKHLKVVLSDTLEARRQVFTDMVDGLVARHPERYLSEREAVIRGAGYFAEVQVTAVKTLREMGRKFDVGTENLFRDVAQSAAGKWERAITKARGLILGYEKKFAAALEAFRMPAKEHAPETTAKVVQPALEAPAPEVNVDAPKTQDTLGKSGQGAEKAEGEHAAAQAAGEKGKFVQKLFLNAEGKIHWGKTGLVTAVPALAILAAVASNNSNKAKDELNKRFEADPSQGRAA